MRFGDSRRVVPSTNPTQAVRNSLTSSIQAGASADAGIGDTGSAKASADAARAGRRTIQGESRFIIGIKNRFTMMRKPPTALKRVRLSRPGTPSIPLPHQHPK